MSKKLLVVEDDPLMQEVLVDGLSLAGFEVMSANGLAKAFSQILDTSLDIIVADYSLRDGTAFELLAWLKARDLRIPVIVLTGHASIDLAVQAVKNGAEQFIPKPVDLGVLTAVVRKVLENLRYEKRDAVHKLEGSRLSNDPFLGTSAAIEELKKSAMRIVGTNSTILIQGETGAGKGVLARWLYNMGQRSNEAFVDLNCAGLSRELLESELFGHQKGAFTGAFTNKVGFLEAANHGTLFLDEIGDLDPQVQPKLLKVVEEKQFYRLGDVVARKADVQMIAATHRDLKKMSEEGQFRSDLYFRITPLRLRIPSLRERPEDIPVITDHLLNQLSREMKRGPLQISDSARLALQQYSWPGNIRELRNVLERAALLSDNGMIHKTGLEFEALSQPQTSKGFSEATLTLKEMEKQYIQQVLDSEKGSVNRAAQRLDMPRSSLYAKINEYGL